MLAAHCSAILKTMCFGCVVLALFTIFYIFFKLFEFISFFSIFALVMVVLTYCALYLFLSICANIYY